MSSEAQPINPARFAEALKELPADSLANIVQELRLSIAHLDLSNLELKPFAEGTELTLGQAPGSGPDQDCIDAIAENETVIARKQERIELIRSEVEGRGLSWTEFQSKPEDDNTKAVPDAVTTQTNGTSNHNETTTTTTTTSNTNTATATNGQHAAWSDGTFQTGTIRGGLSDEELLRQLQERIPELRVGPSDGNDENNNDAEDQEGGMHL